MLQFKNDFYKYVFELILIPEFKNGFWKRSPVDRNYYINLNYEVTGENKGNVQKRTMRPYFGRDLLNKIGWKISALFAMYHYDKVNTVENFKKALKRISIDENDINDDYRTPQVIGQDLISEALRRYKLKRTDIKRVLNEFNKILR